MTDLGGALGHVTLTASASADDAAPLKDAARLSFNQATAERGPEPLRTLATYRRRDGKVYFGQNAVHQGLGRLRVGEPVLT